MGEIIGSTIGHAVVRILVLICGYKIAAEYGLAGIGAMLGVRLGGRHDHKTKPDGF
jgi:hypothetical protein